MKRRASAVAVAASLLLSFGVVGDAVAQQYPPPTPTEKPEKTPKPEKTKKPKKTEKPKDSCLVVEGDDDGTFTVGAADYRSDISIEGSAGCADPFGDISATVFSEPVRMGTFTALEDGSFHRVFCLPAVIEPGDHEVRVSIEGRGELIRDLRVEDDSGEPCGPGDGTVVAGTTQTNTGAGSGALPRSGAGILILVMWALVLVGLGTVLVASAWRYRARLVPIRALRTNRRLGNADPEVPFVDTSRFTPYRSRVARGDRAARRDARGKSEPPTEWDAAHRSERPPN
jgi:hypothetical protein